MSGTVAADAAATPTEFEALLAHRLAGLAVAPLEAIDAEVVAAQRALCELLGTDRSAVWQGTPAAPDVLRLTHLATLDEIPPVPDGTTANGLFPWITGRLLAGELVALPDIEALPEDAAIDLANLRHYGDRSTLAIPLATPAGAPHGAISFAATTRRIAWSPALLVRAQLVAEIVRAVLARKRAEEAARAERDRLEALHAAARRDRAELRKVWNAVEQAPAGVLMVDVDRGVIEYANPEALRRRGLLARGARRPASVAPVGPPARPRSASAPRRCARARRGRARSRSGARTAWCASTARAPRPPARARIG